jgi:hypothetical protein
MGDPIAILTADQLLERAIELRRKDQLAESYRYLRAYLLRDHVLLRLARMSTQLDEARSAAQLALSLEPSADLAQRVRLDVERRFAHAAGQPPGQEHWPTIIALTTGLTLAQARAVNWPFNGINRPIGEILDDGTRTLKDMLWACDNARDTRVRDAARTILLTHLLDAAPEQSPKPLTIIMGSRYSERQERIALVIAGAGVGVGLLLSTVMVVAGVLTTLLGSSLPITVTLYGLMGIAVLLWIIVERRIRDAIAYKVGRWGEERVVEALRTSLDGRWTLIRNFTWPGRKGGDIDLVLVGPGGVWAFEIKAYAGRVRNIGDTWARQGKRGWRRLPINPGAQARRNAANLKAFLDAQSVPVSWVQPVVIWAGGEAADPDDRSILTIEQPKTPVWISPEIADRAGDPWQGRGALDQETTEKIVDLLARTVEQANKQHAMHSPHPTVQDQSAV